MNSNSWLSYSCFQLCRVFFPTRYNLQKQQTHYISNVKWLIKFNLKVHLEDTSSCPYLIQVKITRCLARIGNITVNIKTFLQRIKYNSVKIKPTSYLCGTQKATSRYFCYAPHYLQIKGRAERLRKKKAFIRLFIHL